jgi:hypothetical protein
VLTVWYDGGRLDPDRSRRDDCDHQGTDDRVPGAPPTAGQRRAAHDGRCALGSAPEPARKRRLAGVPQLTAACSLVGGVDAAGRFATCGYPVLAPQSKCKPL